MEEVTNKFLLSEVAVPARSDHDMRPSCGCCKKKKSRVKPFRNLAIKAELEVKNKFKPLEEEDAENIEEAQKINHGGEIMNITKDQDQIAQVSEDDQ